MAISKETSSTSSIRPSPSPAAENPHADARPERSWLAALLALLLGAGCGALQVTLADLSSTALAVTALSMTMGCAWPRRPWRWALILGLCVPAAVFLDWRHHPGRGMFYGSFAMLAPALVAAFGGSFMRKLVGELFKVPNDPLK